MKMLMLLGVFGFLLSGCSMPTISKLQTPYSVKNPLIDGKVKNIRNSDSTFIAEKGFRFVDAYYSARDIPSKENIHIFLDRGITYTNLLCTEYFDNLAYTKSHRDFAQKSTSIANGLTSSLLGLAKSSATSISAVGAIFGFGQATFNNYNEAYIVSPDITNLLDLVNQKQINEEIVIFKKLNAGDNKFWPEKIETLDQAERELNRYISICTANGIRQLVKDSIDKKTVNLKKSNENLEPNEKAENTETQ